MMEPGHLNHRLQRHKGNTNLILPYIEVLRFAITSAPSSTGKIEAGFQVILHCGPRLLPGHPYYETLSNTSTWVNGGMFCIAQNYGVSIAE